MTNPRVILSKKTLQCLNKEEVEQMPGPFCRDIQQFHTKQTFNFD